MSQVIDSMTREDFADEMGAHARVAYLRDVMGLSDSDMGESIGCDPRNIQRVCNVYPRTHNRFALLGRRTAGEVDSLADDFGADVEAMTDWLQANPDAPAPYFNSTRAVAFWEHTPLALGYKCYANQVVALALFGLGEELSRPISYVYRRTSEGFWFVPGPDLYAEGE